MVTEEWRNKFRPTLADRVTGKKREKPLGFDMHFGEALERLGAVDPGELPDEIKLGKKPRPKKKGGGEPPPSKVEGDGG